MKALGAVFLAILIIGAGTGLGWLAQGNDFFMFQFFAPKYEQVRHNTFEQSQAYNEGMIRDLENIMMQYQTADATGKAALKATVMHRFEAYPNRDVMPGDLQAFYNQLKENP